MTESEKTISEWVREQEEELDAYQAIGTVEEFKAIKQWKSDIIESFSKYDVNSVDELMKRFRELTEKAEPKKPSEIDEREEESFYYLAFICSTCKNAVTGQPYRPNYCKHCGQHLNWE